MLPILDYEPEQAIQSELFEDYRMTKTYHRDSIDSLLNELILGDCWGLSIDKEVIFDESNDHVHDNIIKNGISHSNFSQFV